MDFSPTKQKVETRYSEVVVDLGDITSVDICYNY